MTVYVFTKSSSYLYAGTGGYGILKSTSNGQNWTQTELSSQTMLTFATNGNYVYAGAVDGVYISSNNGVNWTHTSLNNDAAYSIAISGSTIFAGCGYAFYQSTNGGANWVQGALNEVALSLIVSGSYVFAGTYNGVYVTTNNGINWTQTSLNNRSVPSLAFGSNILYAGTESNGLYYSTNNGTNWVQTSLNSVTVSALTVSGSYIFVGTDVDGIYFSSNNGQNWFQKNQGIGVQYIEDLFISDSYIYAGTEMNSAWRRGLSEAINVKKISEIVPSGYSLNQNYPNPFNPNTKISYQIVKSGFVTLSIYDMVGREIAVLVNENQSPGTYEYTFNASGFSSGIYFYKLKSGDFSFVKKMALIK